MDYQSREVAIDDAVRLAKGITKKHDMFHTGFSGAKMVVDYDIPLEDEDWTDVKRQYYNMRKSIKVGGYALDEDEVWEVFLIQHGRREDTILILSSCRRPPLRFVQYLLKECPESISLIDTPLYD